jgi:Lon protease-like protein
MSFPLIPIFPLPNVVLFPNIFLPLHIFEPRYRTMVADALAGDRIIGMALLKAGWESDYEGRPAVYPIGCSGLITHAEPLDDGCYNIVLRGLEKFRIVAEDAGGSYRQATIDPILESFPERDRRPLKDRRRALEAVLARRLLATGAESSVPSQMPDDDLVNALSQYLDFAPIERQALLECNGVVERCDALIELIEMNVLADGYRVRETGRH